MDKRIFRYFYLLLIFLVIININIISAGEIDQSTDSISQDVLSDSTEMDQLSITDDAVISNEGDSNLKVDANAQELSETIETSDSSQIDEGTVSDTPKHALKKAQLTAKLFVIKGEYLEVNLKDSSNKGIANEKVALRLNGKTHSAITDSKGIAKFKINEAGKTYKTIMKFYGNSIPHN